VQWGISDPWRVNTLIKKVHAFTTRLHTQAPPICCHAQRNYQEKLGGLGTQILQVTLSVCFSVVTDLSTSKCDSSFGAAPSAAKQLTTKQANRFFLSSLHACNNRAFTATPPFAATHVLDDSLVLVQHLCL
jgi:hypothetical protein